MVSSTPATHYARLSIALHWLMLVLLAAVYALIELRGLFPKDSVER
ncbi:cytochrome B, partial [Klebsiella pneumoniae]|nr:cytochrome B [Klebsiella pneumoniae]